MNKKIKTVIAAAAVLAGGLAVAIIAYNSLSGHVIPADALKAYARGETVGVPGADIPDTGLADGDNAKDKAAHDFVMLDKKGETVKLSDHYGKPIVMNFWASWCPPCRSEMPAFDKLYNEKGDIVNVMMVNLTDGYREDMDSALAFAEGNGYGFPVYFDTRSEGARGYGIISMPTTVFISSDGNVKYTYTGAMNEETLNAYVDSMLY